MRKRVAFRALIILLASALLLTSTGAYNILVFADQNMELSSLSAADEGVASAPSVATYGGEILPDSTEIQPIRLATQSVDGWEGEGTQQSPFEIDSVSKLLDALDIINDYTITTGKWFVLTDDINLSGLSISDFHNSAVSSAAYLLSAEGSNPSAVYFKLDGNDHTISFSGNSVLDASGYRFFALFGLMNQNCEVKNLTIENVHVSLANASAASVVAFKNRGTIQNVTVKDCSMTVSGSTANIDSNISSEAPYSYLDNNSNTGNDIYPGFAAVAADNRGSIGGSEGSVVVENFQISVSNGSHYLGGVVAQNRGSIGQVAVPAQSITAHQGAEVNGLRIAATASNAYIGGISAFNGDGHTVANSSINLPGYYYDSVLDIDETYDGQIYGGRYVGGLVGMNNGILTNSVVEGSFGTVSTPSAEAYDICGVVRSDDVTAESYVPYYYGGAAAGGSGTVSKVTVLNLGFYMSLVSVEQPCYFGGITAKASAAGAVVGCVSTGSFVSSAYSAVCHAGGVIGYAPANAANETLSNCYALFRLQNKGHYLTGAVIGFGGTTAAASNCYWSSEISGCITAYAIPNADNSSIIETISDRSMDLIDSSRAVLSRRNVTLSDTSHPIAQPTHSWSGGTVETRATIASTDNGNIGRHVVQGVVNSLDAAIYQQTLTLPSGIGCSECDSFDVDFKLDIFIVASDDGIGDPNDQTNPLQISSSGMTRFLFMAPYGNYVLTQDATIDETEWEPVAFYGQLSGTFNNVTHSIYAPCRLFSAVVGARSANVSVTGNDTDGYTSSLDYDSVIGGYIQQLSVTLTPDYFVLAAGACNKSVFGSLFDATMRSVTVANDTDQSAKLTGSRQGIFADAAYDHTYLYGCSVNVSLECSGNGTDMGAFLGYLDPNANVVDNCVIDADVTLASGSTVTNAAAFIGNIGLDDNDASSSYVLNSVVVTTVDSGAASVFGAAPEGETVAARRFDNVFWARNSYSEESVPIGGARANYNGLVLWGSTNTLQTARQYYTCNHVLNSGDALVELTLPEHIAKISIDTVNKAKSEFLITRFSNANGQNEDTRYYNNPEMRLVNGKLMLSFVPTSAAYVLNDSTHVDVFKITNLKTGLCAYIQITAQTTNSLVSDADGYYKIQSAADLKNLSDAIANGDNVLAKSAFKLYADIDMSYFDGTSSDRVFYPIGGKAINASSSFILPFSGVFIGATDPETGEPYTISNVTVVAANNNTAGIAANNGLFGVIDTTLGNTNYIITIRDAEENETSVPYTKACEIGNFNLDNINVVGGDCSGALAGSVVRQTNSTYNMYNYPIHDVCVTNSSVTGGTGTQTSSGQCVGGLIGEVSSSSVALSGITLESVEVATYFSNLAYSNRVASRVNDADAGYFTSDYFQHHWGIGGVVGSAYNANQPVEINYQSGYIFSTALTITDTNVSHVTVSGAEDLDGNKAYATMDAGGIIGSVLNKYDASNRATSVNIGDPNTENDVIVEDSQIMAYGNTGGIIGASDAATVLNHCVVRGSADYAGITPEKSAMQVRSRTLYYLGGIAGYVGISSNMAASSSTKSPNDIYASIKNCSVVNANVAFESTDSPYTGTGATPERNISVGGVIGGGNGQGYLGNESVPEDEDLAPFVSGCTINHSRIEGIVTGGIVGADAEIQYTADNDLSGSLLGSVANARDLITNCSVVNSQITTVDGATRIAGDCPDSSTEITPNRGDRFILASGVGGIMGTNVRFHYTKFDPRYNKGYGQSLKAYGYLHDTIIQYCTVDSSTTVESNLPFTEATTMCSVAVGGVIGNAFTNAAENAYHRIGACVLRYNEMSASLYNSAELTHVVDTFTPTTNGEVEVKAGTGGFIGMVKGGTNYKVTTEGGNTSRRTAICNVSGIHVYTSVFNGSLRGKRGLGGAIGVINFAGDCDYSANPVAVSSWTSVGGVPSQMLSNLALAGTITLSGSDQYYNNGTCCGGYVIGHISTGAGQSYTFDSNYSRTVSNVFSSITYTSFACGSNLLPFGFLNIATSTTSSPRFVGSGCYYDVNRNSAGTANLFSDVHNDVSATATIYFTAGNGNFVIKQDNLSEYNWRGSDESVATVTNTYSYPVNDSEHPNGKKVTVVGKRFGTVQVSIPFVGYLSDNSGSGAWDHKEVFIPCGFLYESKVQPDLAVARKRLLDPQTGLVVLDENDEVVYEKEYRLVQTPYDMNVVGQHIAENANNIPMIGQKQAEEMSWSYALYVYDGSGAIEFTDDMFAANGSFPGGLTPVGTLSYPFTGSFETLPAGEYDVDYVIGSDGEIAYENDVQVTSITVPENPENVTLRNVKVKAANNIGASLFGAVSGAAFRNFDIDGLTLIGTTSGNYLGAIASKVFTPQPSGTDPVTNAPVGTAPITIDGVNLNRFTFSDADYIGGLVGGIFANSNPSALSAQDEVLSQNTTPSVITRCTVGNPDPSTIKKDSYTNSMTADLGAGGLIAHTSKQATNISACTVRDVAISQSYDDYDYIYLDRGAAGIAMAYAGTMGDDPETAAKERVVVEHCAITGEVVGGAVVRSYTSNTETNFGSAGTYGYYPGDGAAKVTCPSAAKVELIGIDVKDSELLGTIDVNHDTTGAARYSASGGILARVDADTSNHLVEDCTVDQNTTIEAVDAVGGIVGCFDSLGAQIRRVRYEDSPINAQFGVKVTDCTMNATLIRTAIDSTNDELNFNRGVGGVIGVFYEYTPLIFTQISGCTVGGVIRAQNAAGGVVGSILTQTMYFNAFTRDLINNYFDFSTMDADTHFVSNCLVTAQFIMRGNNNTDVSPFEDRSLGIGVVLGYSHSGNTWGGVVNSTESENGYSTNNNYPFYHVMFSSANYIPNNGDAGEGASNYGCVALYGFGTSTNDPYMNGREEATKYCYDLNRTSADPENANPAIGTTHFSIDSDGSLIPASRTRINAKLPNDAGVLEVSSIAFNNANANTVAFGWGADLEVDEEELVVDTHTTNGGAVTYEDYTLQASAPYSSALPYAFTAASDSNPADNNAGYHKFSFVLDSVELASESNLFDLTYYEPDNGHEAYFTLSLKENQSLDTANSEDLRLTVIFTYTNGMKMSMNILINKHAAEYWRYDDTQNNRTYFLVFNAADLAALQTHLSTQSNSRANARVIQCYDVFWTVSDPDVILAARAALKQNNVPLTIGQVLGSYLTSSLDLGSGETFNLGSKLGSFMRPNPAYDPNDPQNNQPQEISFSAYFSSYANLSTVPMEEVVGDIGAVGYGVFGEENLATIIDPYDYNNDCSVPFTGKYITLKNQLARSTGVTESGESYAIYGLDLRDENVVANTGTDSPYAGLIAQIGNNAIVDGVRFINPKISVINSYGVSCSAGILAGTVTGSARISNISIEDTGEAISHIKAITRVNAASVSAGGVIGEVYGHADVYNVAVSGLDVVASYMANAGENDDVTILIGGIAGKAVDPKSFDPEVLDPENANPPSFRNVDVTDCYVLGGHIANPVGSIRSYGGGMFGLMNASVEPYSGTETVLIPNASDPQQLDQVQVARQSEVSGTVVGGSFITTTDYVYDRTNQNNTALDVAGGVAAETIGVCTVTAVNVIGSTIVGGDVAGGIAGQIWNRESNIDAWSSLEIMKSGVGMQRLWRSYNTSTHVASNPVTPIQNATSVLVVGASGKTDRFNTAGGVVGNVQDLDYLYIGNVFNDEEGVDFNGVVGTFGYDNHNREATAGGMIGSISGLTFEEFGNTGYVEAGWYEDYNDYLSYYLDMIQIYGCTVQGEVNGFNRVSVANESDVDECNAVMKCGGSAGGIIGKIACAARKNLEYLDDNPLFIYDCIMSAKVNLYNSVYGMTVDCADNQRNRRRDTNVGKLIGRMADGALIDADCDPIVAAEDIWQEIKDESSFDYGDLGAWTEDRIEAFSHALRGELWKPGTNLTEKLIDQYCAVTDSIQYVYGSSYPQDIVLYGNHNLCGIDLELYADTVNYMADVPLPYFDCNQVNRYIADYDTGIEDEEDPDHNTIVAADQSALPMQVQSFMVSEDGPNTGDAVTVQTEYESQQYTENAFIPLDTDPNAPTEHYKYFRFYNSVYSGLISESKLVFREDDIDVLDVNGEPVAGASASAEYFGTTMYDEVFKYDLSDPENLYEVERVGYTYNAGVMTIDLPREVEMVGRLVLNFDYGIQMSSSFTSIEIDGDGSENDPYLIKEPKHFFVMRALHSNNAMYFKQMKNIDLNMLNDPNNNVLNRYTSVDGFEPIGTLASPFVGHFDGNGYVTKNLYINDEVSNATGLFGCVGKNAELKNIHIEIADALIIQNLEDERTVVNGGIIGGNNTGGLVGIIKTTGNDSTTTVTNCSVAGGYVIGGMNVGGLIGAAAGSVELDNCFTSTTTASYAGNANVGALLGAVVSGECALSECYTAGLAVAGSANPSSAAVGGLVGRNNSTCSLTLNDCFVSATASGNTADTVGLAVAANNGTITAASVDNTVAVLMSRENRNKTVYVIAPLFSDEDNNYESKMIEVTSSDDSTAIDYSGTSYDEVTSYVDFIPAYTTNVYTGSVNDTAGPDAYSAAYRELIAAAVKVDQSRQAFDANNGNNPLNQIQSENIIRNGGLLYPLTMTFDKATVFTTSVYDLSDTVAYPMGLDQDLTGNGSNKNTDLLFKTTTDETTVGGTTTNTYHTTIYRNIFRSNDEVDYFDDLTGEYVLTEDAANAQIVRYDGQTYANGEIYYDYEMPYAVASQTVVVGGETIDIARKIMYPVASIEPLTPGDSQIYPIATARQLKAMTSSSETVNGTKTKFDFLRSEGIYSGTLDYQNRKLMLVADIDLTSTAFTPLDPIINNYFYGNGHVISNMQINQVSGVAAMFTSIQAGGVHDLGLMGVNVVDSSATDTAAMLVGNLNSGVVSNCFAIGSVKATEGTEVGGLVASATGSVASPSTIKNSMVSGSVIGLTDDEGHSGVAAGLLGEANGTVYVNNVTVTANVEADETYAIYAPGSNASVTVTNTIYGGQMTSDIDQSNEPPVIYQHLTPVSGASALYADNGLDLQLDANGASCLVATYELVDDDFVTAAHFPTGGMISIGDGYYPVAATFASMETPTFQAGICFAAAAIQLSYIGRTDMVSSVSAPSNLNDYGTARLDPDNKLGAYANAEGGLLTINPDSMRLTKWNEERDCYEAAPEVTGVNGSITYSMVSPVSNNHLKRTVNGVKVQKTFTLCYELVGADSGDKAIVTVENLLRDVSGESDERKSTTGLADSVTGNICDNMMIKADENGDYVLWAYSQLGSGQKVDSVTVRPAYLTKDENNNDVIFSNVTATTYQNDPAKSSFSGTDSTIGHSEDNGYRYSYLLVTVNVDDAAWGLQRTNGNWIFDSVSQGS